MTKEKSRNSIKISARLPNKTESTELYLLIDKEAFSNIPEFEQKRFLQFEMQNVQLQRSFVMNTTLSVYSFDDPEPHKRLFDYANTRIEAHLPYCLNIPTNFNMEVTIGDKGYSAYVMFEKIWTELGKGSDLADFFAENEVTYFQKNVAFNTPKFPIDEKLGWEQKFEGTNIERLKDRNGTFRFTRVIIQFDTPYTEQDLDKKEEEKDDSLSKIVSTVSAQALEVVNRVLDAYRFITKEEYIERLGTLAINDIYFTDLNTGIYIASMGFGIGNATMNRSRKELNEIEAMLVEGTEPPFYELLFLDAASNIQKKSLTLAAVESFQALEIFLEGYLFHGYKQNGFKDAEVEFVLSMKWFTKDRLKGLLKDITRHSLSEESALWSSWYKAYEETRNEVIHKGKEITANEAESSLKLNKDVVAWIKGLTIEKTGTPLALKILKKKPPLSNRIKKVFLLFKGSGTRVLKKYINKERPN